MKSIDAFIASRSRLITQILRDPDTFKEDLESKGLQGNEAEIRKSLNIPATRDIIFEALATLSGDEITTYGNLAKLVGGRAAQGVASIVVSDYIGPIAASRVFHAPKDGAFIAKTDPGNFKSSFGYLDRIEALVETDIKYIVHGDALLLTDFTFVDVDQLSERINYLILSH